MHLPSFAQTFGAGQVGQGLNFIGLGMGSLNFERKNPCLFS